MAIETLANRKLKESCGRKFNQ